MLRAADPGSARASAGERKRRGDDSNANIAAKKGSNLSCLPKARLHLSPLLGAALSAGATGSLSPTAFLKCRNTSWASWGSPGKKQRCQAGGLLLQPSAPGRHWGIGAAAPKKNKPFGWESYGTARWWWWIYHGSWPFGARALVPRDPEGRAALTCVCQ